MQMGGTVGRLVSDALARFLPEPWTLIAAGAGAGLAVAFNAPLAAVIFVVEELLHRFSARVFSATLMACISGTVVLRLMLGNATEFGGLRTTALPAAVLPSYCVLGVLAGFLGVGFNVSLLAGVTIADRAARWPPGIKGRRWSVRWPGCLPGLRRVWWAGEKAWPSRGIVSTLPLKLLCMVLAVRFVLTIASYSSGVPGGIFAPLLALGALLGSGFASLESSLFHHPFDPAPYAICRDGRLLHVSRAIAVDRRRFVAGNDWKLAADSSHDGRVGHRIRRAGTARKSSNLRFIAGTG